MGVFRGGEGAPPPIAPKNCLSTSTKDRLAALLRCAADVLAVCRPIEAADVAVVTADVHDVYKDYAQPMCRVDVYRP